MTDKKRQKLERLVQKMNERYKNEREAIRQKHEERLALMRKCMDKKINTKMDRISQS